MKEVPFSASPRPYPHWRTQEVDRAEDAAYAFGADLVRHCRDEALASVPIDAAPEVRAAAEQAVDVALHSVMDLLEGFWPLSSGESHRLEYALHVRVRDSRDAVVDEVAISPARVDLPIGYWKWVHDREFR